MKEVLADEVIAVTETVGEVAKTSPLTNLIPLAVFVAVFYFLLIRPQQKRAKEHAEEVKNLKTGDKVVTDGGIFGRVISVKENSIVIEIADGIKIEVVPNMVNLVKNEKPKDKKK